MKKNNRKGFTLAELLIVVAIIAVLVAIAIPIFTAQLEKSREATDLSNVRSAYAELVADYLTADPDDDEIDPITVPAKQREDNWQYLKDEPATTKIAEGHEGSNEGVEVPADTTSYVVSIDMATGIVTVTGGSSSGGGGGGG